MSRKDLAIAFEEMRKEAEKMSWILPKDFDSRSAMQALILYWKQQKRKQSRDESVDSTFSTQVDGNHYMKLAIQPAEYIYKNGLGFLEGTVIKYVTRYKDKNGEVDLDKAIHCLQLLKQLAYSK